MDSDVKPNTDKHCHKSVSILLSAITSLCLLLSPVTAQTTTSYEYDDLGQLIEVDRSDGKDRAYAYDEAGNRTCIASNGDTCSGGGGSNGAPTAVADFVSVSNGGFTIKNLVSNDTDPENDTLSITAVTQPSNGSVFIFSSTTVRVSGTVTGFGVFTYTISDGNNNFDTGDVSVNVTGCGLC